MAAGEIVAVLMVIAVCVALFAGYPVALTFAGVSLAFAAIGQLAGILNFSLLGALPARIFGIMTNAVLLAIPLFIFMGVMLERSRIVTVAQHGRQHDQADGDGGGADHALRRRQQHADQHHRNAEPARQ